MTVLKLFNSEWITFSIFFFTIIAFVGISDLLLKKLKISTNSSRRFVHILVGVLVSISPFLFQSPLPPSVLAITFILLNAIGLKKDMMKGMHSIERISYGTVFFPITYLVLILLYWHHDPTILIIGMLIMTFADPLGSVVGELFNTKKFIFWKDQKSIAGSFTVFLTSFLLSSGGFYLYRLIDDKPIPGILSLFIIGVVVGIVAVLGEAISNAGTDNLSLPLLSAFMLDLVSELPLHRQVIVLFWVIFTVIFAILAFKAGLLNESGTAGAMLMGCVIFSVGGFSWFLPMVVFFVLSSLLSKFGKKKNEKLNQVVQKGHKRDIIQVYANAGVAMVCAILYFYFKFDVLYIMYLGSLAAATADTWATEIGVLSKSDPRHIIKFSKVPSGSSGAISFVGTFGALIGASVLAMTSFSSQIEISVYIFGLIVFAGFFGSIVDSILGATVQAQYQCTKCKKITEKLIHCEVYVTTQIKGKKWIDNDFVNLCCTASGAIFIYILF